MPIYEYACQKCGHEVDALQKVSDPLLRKCPECGALRLKRLVSAPQFRLKGSGWYETDFKKDNKKRLVDTGDGAPPAPAADTEKSTTADKPAAAPAAEKPAKADKPAAKPVKARSKRPAAAG